jgi:hypothetical protein
MKNFTKFSFALVVILFGTSCLFSQPGRGLKQSEITKLYNAAAAATLEGKIANVVVVDSSYGRFPAVIVDLKTNDKEVKVYIAPRWHLVNEKIELKKDQSLTVTGSRVTHNDQPLIITRTMKYAGKEITFRDSKGIPVWAGRATGPGAGRGKGRKNR